MKKLFYILAAAALLAGLAGCNKNEATKTPLESVDLRYRANDKYELDAVSPRAFNIVVKSTKPWTVRSYHPDWCIISDEEGEAQPDSLVHVGKGENTTVTIQYYDNTELDDRTDIIEIASFGYIGKKVTVYQKGIAYLNVPEADLEEGLMIEKVGGELAINVRSNQKWTAAIVPDAGAKADWVNITEGASGELDGVVKMTVQENSGEKRYAHVAVYDRNGEERALVKITQDGVQLDPEAFEIRVGYDQPSASLSVVCNTRWEAQKNASDDWYTIENPSGHEGDGTINITFHENAGTGLRRSSIILKTVAANPGDAVAEKEIVVKQAYRITPVRHIVDNDELGSWKSDWDNLPAYTKDYGTLFTAKARLPFGTYTFRWKDITPNPAASDGIRVRHWFCFKESCEMKFDLRPVDGKCSFEFNAAGDGNKPSLSSFTDVDWTQPVEITYKFDPNGADYCHVTYLVNGQEAGSFDTSENMLRTVTWGAEINMYFGVDKSGSAVLDWYEYTAPMNWDE